MYVCFSGGSTWPQLQDLGTLVSILHCYNSYCREESKSRVPARRGEDGKTAGRRLECMRRHCREGNHGASSPGGGSSGTSLAWPARTSPSPAARTHHSNTPPSSQAASASGALRSRRKRISDANFFVICADIVCSGLQGVEYYMCSYTKCIKGSPSNPGSLPGMSLRK